MGRVILLEEAIRIGQQLKAAGQIVVLTNGHFDLLHWVHVACLQEARKLGDALFVGVNSDAATRQLKGPGRPIVPEGERVAMLAALAAVDYAFIFDGLTAEGVVEALQPAVYVKGGDWSPMTGSEPPEAAVVRRYGGRLCYIPYLPGHSTTDLIAAILERYGK